MVMQKAAAEASAYRLPQKVSLALSAGTEVLIHGFRDVLSAHGHDPENVLLRFESRNAFNEIFRSAFLHIVIHHISAAAQLAQALYNSQSFLNFGGRLLRSCKGTQKGDPLGGFFLVSSFILMSKALLITAASTSAPCTLTMATYSMTTSKLPRPTASSSQKVPPANLLQ